MVQIRCRNFVIRISSWRPGQIIIGTIKPQGQLDGKFKAKVASKSLECHECSDSAVCTVLFRGDPEPQAEGYGRHGTDAAEPERGKPQQTLRQSRRIWFDPRQ
jgi:hypothetical protein